MTILDVCAIIIAVVLVWAKLKGWGRVRSYPWGAAFCFFCGEVFGLFVIEPIVHAL